MLQIRQILFPTDYSACAEHAFSQAAYLAEQYDAVLHVLHVAEPPRDLLSPLEITDADIAADLHMPSPPAEEAPAHDGVVHAEVLPADGSVVRAILDYAGQHDVDLIVMGTHGRHGIDRLLLGSVANKVLRLAACPVFTVGVGAETGAKGAIARVLAPVDFSEHARLAVAYARELAATYGAHLDLLHVVAEMTMPTIYGVEPLMVRVPDVEQKAREALEQLARETAGDGVSVGAHVHIGPPALDIVEFAEQQGSDLIVIATHGLTGIKRLLLGSVAEGVVQRAPCPVFTVKSFGKRLLAPSAEAVTAGQQAGAL